MERKPFFVIKMTNRERGCSPLSVFSSDAYWFLANEDIF